MFSACIEEGNSFQVVLCEPFPFHNECISEFQWGGKKNIGWFLVLI